MNRQKNISFVSIKEIRLEDSFFLPLAEFFFLSAFFLCHLPEKREREPFPPEKREKERKEAPFPENRWILT